jgi:uncharacterized protein YecE (DUF72 family)
MSKVLTGICSWTDKTLLQSGWYPPDVKTPEERLAYYARQFPLVEVDGTYYRLPSEQTAALWAERTPPDFTFDVKAFRLFTQHPTPVNSLPKALREAIPKEAVEKPNLYVKDLPSNVTEELWSMYRQALMPLHSAGKLGVVLFQFPPWFVRSKEHLDYLLRIKEHLPDYSVAIEFRQPSWMDEESAPRTIDFLRSNNLIYTSVDEPQGTRASVPPIAVATSDIAVVRFHGRRIGTWDKRNVSVQERFQYLYSEDELKGWVPKIKELAAKTREVHVLMNNCYSDYAVRNAAQLAVLLEQS